MISVVTCVYNQRQDYFEECLESVVNQPGQIEWIVVDDGSSLDFHVAYRDCLAQIGLDYRVTLVRLPENVGLSRARNEGFRRAVGDWVVVLDSDDRLARPLAAILRTLPEDAALACFAVDYFDASTVEHRPVLRWRNLYRQFGLTAADPFLWFDFYYHGIIARLDLIRRIGGYDDGLEVGEDQDILLRACEAVGIENVAFCDEVGYHYRKNPDGVCAMRWREVEENYGATMVAAARRRGADFTECRFAGTCRRDGALIDTYVYRSGARWLSWEDYLSEVQPEGALVLDFA